MNQKIKNQSCASLDQLASVVAALNTAQYAQPLTSLHQTSIGKHVRHILEFFQCLDFAVASLVVNYDNRQRNLRLEESPSFALGVIQELKAQIAVYQEKTLTLEADYGEGNISVLTTLFRELVYNIEHCVHHLAIIKIGLNAHFPEIQLEDSIGVAYSTQQFQKAS